MMAKIPNKYEKTITYRYKKHKKLQKIKKNIKT